MNIIDLCVCAECGDEIVFSEKGGVGGFFEVLVMPHQCAQKEPNHHKPILDDDQSRDDEDWFFHPNDD